MSLREKDGLERGRESEFREVVEASRERERGIARISSTQERRRPCSSRSFRRDGSLRERAFMVYFDRDIVCVVKRVHPKSSQNEVVAREPEGCLRDRERSFREREIISRDDFD